MKARFLRSLTLEELRSDVPKNLRRYREGDFGEIAADPAHWFEQDFEVREESLATLRAPVGEEYFEVENCVVVHDAFPGLSPYEARDERLWAYLSHTLLLAHARARWPIPPSDDEAVAHIRKHYFARDKRQIERDNVGSRLWWMAHLCGRIDSLDRETALRAFLFRSDVRANLIERPTTSQSVAVFGTIVELLSESLVGKKRLFERDVFRELMREINSIGGYRLLDHMPSSDVHRLMKEIVGERLGLAEL